MFFVDNLNQLLFYSFHVSPVFRLQDARPCDDGCGGRARLPTGARYSG